MSNPATKANAEEAATQVTDSGDGYEEAAVNTNDKSTDFASKVNDAVSKMTQDAKGNWVLPDDITDEAVKHAATIEKRFRDTQGAFTKERQKTKALEAEVSVLKPKAVGAVQLNLTDEQTAELDELKFSDPEAWRKKMNTYERNALKAQEEQLEKEVKETTTSTLEKDELERRETVLSEFLETHKGFELNDDIIANDIPPRITKKLNDGTITFEQFLEECYNYSKTGKVIKQKDGPNLPNLSKVGGGDKPDANAMKEDVITSYDKEVY